MADLDRLSIQIEANTRGATNQIGKLADKLSALTAVIDKIDSSKFETLANATNSLSQGLSGLKGSNVKQIAKVGEALDNIKSNDNAFTNVVEGAKDLGENSEKATTDIYNILGALKSGGESTVFQSVNKQLEEFSGKALTSESSVKGLKGMLASLKIIIPTKELDRTEKKFESLKQKAQDLSEQMDFKSKTVDGYVDSKAMESDKAKLEGLINEMERLKLKQKELESNGGFQFNTDSLSGAKKILSNIGSTFTSITAKSLKFVETFAGIPWMVNRIGKSVKKLKGHFDNLVKSLSRIHKMARLMVTRKILQAVIKNALSGFTNLIQYSAKFDASVSLLWNSMRQLGNAVAAMVAPLINALAPALNMIIQLCIKAVNAINQLISALLGGKTWIKATTLTDDYAKSLEKGSKSANKLKNSILGFDEINKLDDNSDSGAGGLTDPKDMFSTEGIDEKWKNFANKLKEMFNKADFTELGKILGTKLKQALDKIPWLKIKQTARKIGKSLATLINGGIEVEGLGTSIGNTIAQAINTAFEFANSFVHNLHWESVGKFIADTFNGFFENIDWEKIKDTIKTSIKGIASSINSFIKNFNWDNISTTLSEMVNILSDAIYTFFTEVDFDDLGSKLGEQLKLLIENIDWYVLGQALGAILQNAINFVKNTLKGLDWEGLKNAISNLVKGLFEQVDIEEVAVIISAILGASIVASSAKVIGSAVVSQASQRIATSIFSKLGGSVAEKELSDSLSNTMLGCAEAPPSSLKNACSTLGTLIASLVVGEQVFEGATSFWSKMILEGMSDAGYSKEDIETTKKELSEMEERYSGFAGKILLFKDALTGENQEPFTAFSKNAKTASEDINKCNIVVEDLRNSSKNLSKENGVGIFVDKSKVAIDGMNNSAKNIDFSNIVVQSENLKNSTGKAFDETKNKMTVMSQSIQNDTANLNHVMVGEVNSLTKTVENGSTNIQTQAENMKSAFSNEKWNLKGIRDGLSASFESAISAVKQIWNRFANWLNEKAHITIDPIRIMGQTIFSGADFRLFKLPTFATGGFPEDGLFMANHGEMVGKFSNGKTAVANNEQITDGIAQAVYSAIVSANSQNGNGQYINNTIQIDGETIARAVTKGQQSINRRYSPTMA